jgi:hypothetical protein
VWLGTVVAVTFAVLLALIGGVAVGGIFAVILVSSGATDDEGHGDRQDSDARAKWIWAV